MFLVISYDVPNDKRRAKIAKALENVGRRVQYSVFECLLTAKQLATVQKTLAGLLVPLEDSVRIYSLPKDALPDITILGVGTVTAELPFYLPRRGVPSQTHVKRPRKKAG